MTTFVIDAEHGIRVLDSGGWRYPIPGECIEVAGGNHIQVNAESYWTGLIQGFAAGLLGSLIFLGIYAAAVS